MSDDIAVRTKELAGMLTRFCASDGLYDTAIPRLGLARLSAPTEPRFGLHEPALCLIVQGAKKATLGKETYIYDPAHYLVVSVDVPVFGHVIQASAEEPYLGIRLDLDVKGLSDMMLDLNIRQDATLRCDRAMNINLVTPRLLDAMIRLVSLLDSPGDISYIAPLAEREILYWLINGEQGPLIQQIANRDSRLRRISAAIQHIRERFREPFDISELLDISCMSSAAFFQHFKAVTHMTPLQYQKQLRLQEARSLMFSQDLEVSRAGYEVGYDSPSQFSREYSRMFGLSPSKDMERYRTQEDINTVVMA
ncbi:AraC family transcriptional regulator [Pokkaliibacter sp. MBI-7]|uniref:AraC family transcriptional regulator n=1 Tax=Pokkaliibacter sp. MBI-7 TaxID=3040600 RepID=UPI00244CEAA7|nr:AraC family transcriptional regulator [Pokkaliibacter sp. MBI-7]MDH2435507.1 AraC family transcriptional regulator [Pokkaliibacter sp. MBI-7]